MNKSGNILSINISEKKGSIKKSIEKGILKKDHGIVGDRHAGNHYRQISLLGTESIEKIKGSKVNGLCTNKFTENITTKGIDLHNLSVGTKLKIGNTIQEITQKGKKCYEFCEIKNKEECILHKEVIFTKVVIGGEIKCSDEIELI